VTIVTYMGEKRHFRDCVAYGIIGPVFKTSWTIPELALDYVIIPFNHFEISRCYGANN